MSDMHGVTIIPRGGHSFLGTDRCPGGQSCLGMNVQGDNFSRRTSMPPTGWMNVDG